MGSGRSIVKKWKMNIYALLVIILIQVLALLLLNSLFTAFSGQMNLLTTGRSVVLIFAGVICILVDLFFLYTKIILLRKLSFERPIKCRIEDIIYIGYKEEGQTKYSPYPIVRSIKDGRLYFTYDSYSLLRYNTSSVYFNNGMVDHTIYKQGRIPVKVGDIVDMYLLKILNIPVLIDAEKNIIRLKNKKIRFDHMNNRISIDVFSEMIFFQGAIDLDADSSVIQR